MPKILNPKDINGTTRFTFDFELTPSMTVQLVKEFKEEYSDFQSTKNAIKLINKKEKRAIEISDDCISLFPSLSETETENIRKRIYRNIAKKSEVYFSTSKENLELSISSLLTDDLRSCASLLYYYLHKFTNSQLYSYFNTKLDLEDHEIDFKEIEHFTSANFYNFVRKTSNLQIELLRENYLEVLCINKLRCIDPFILFRNIISTEVINECYETFKSYVEYLCVNLFEQNFDGKDLSNFLNKEVENFYKRKSSGTETTTHEDEVRASIAYAIEKSINCKQDDKSLWMFYALSLRVYWLRQTADYEFDFEVKTSIREMSILVYSIRYFLDIQIKNEIEEKKLENEIEKEDIENDAFAKNREEDIVINHEESKGIINGYYSVDTKFPNDINYDDEYHIFITAIHLDSNFNKDNVIMALNLTENITNKGKYFILFGKKTPSDLCYGRSPTIQVEMNCRQPID